MSRADEARRRERDDERDRLAHERPGHVIRQPAVQPAHDAWEGFCAGNRTQAHGWPSGKTATHWRCGSCGLWLTAPTRTQTCTHDFSAGDAPMCRRCGAVPEDDRP